MLRIRLAQPPRRPGAHLSPDAAAAGPARPRPQGRHKRRAGRARLLGRVARLLVVAAAGLLAACAPAGQDTVAAPAAAASSAAPTSAASRPVARPPASVAATPSGALTPTVHAKPTLTHRTVTTTRKIPFGSSTVQDATLAAGVRRAKTRGVAGAERLTWSITYLDGLQEGKRLLSRVTVRQPVAQVTVLGTKRPSAGSPAPGGSGCDRNYSGCVPIASDVDCAGGTGNGPAYASGPVRVVGRDIYGLDADHDGVGCE